MRRRVAWAAAGLWAAACSIGCSSSPGSGNTVTPVGPSFAEFVGTDHLAPGVHTFLENQCATLDCHGQIGRPLRLYSIDGLREPNDAGLVSGSGDETSGELFANYLSTISVEPEEMTRVVQGQDSPLQLLLMKKPMGLERHKGGTRILMGDPMYNCLFGWLTNHYSQSDCAAAAALR